MRKLLYTLLTSLVCVATMSAGASPPVAAKMRTPTTPIVRLEAAPTSISLVGPKAVQHILVTAIGADESRRDVTSLAKFSVPITLRAVSVNSDGLVAGHKDGQSFVTAAFGGRSVRVPVSVTGSTQPLTYSFVDDVVPIMSRMGCSMGTCHGAASGKGGFRLSLRGYAPEIDFASITRQLGGRRICREDPERSLFLRKPLMEVPHRGGKRFTEKSVEYKVLLGWLKQGAPGPSGTEPALARLEILPGDRTMRSKETQKLLVRATFADGRTEDVSDRAIYASNDIAVATVDSAGTVTMERAGETAVTAKYMDKLAVSRVLCAYNQKVSESAFVLRSNYIDDLVNAKLKQLHIEPSGLCSDNEFLRRAFIDAIGTLPTADEARAFLADTDTAKRTKLIASLLERPEYGQVWALKFGDLFVLRREYMHRKYAMVMQQWMAEQFNANRPWDRIATDILTAKGPLETNPAGYFYVSRTPAKPNQGYWVRAVEPTAEMTAEVFLGTRIQCAKCHNHPTERYTQDDYYHFAALWQQVGGKGENDDGVPETLTADDTGDVRQLRTNEVMTPRPLDRSDLGFVKAEDRRMKSAQWLVRQDEFARNIVNRFWARCFGMGIIEPVDDIRSTNPAKNEPLMRALCDDLRSHNYDLKRLMSVIMNSRTYQLSPAPRRTNVVDTKLFSHYPTRRLPAEELVDAVAQVTGVPDRFNGMGAGSRAIELADTEIPSLTLDTFGRPPRVQPSDSERNCSPAISQALAMLNSESVQQKLKSNDCVLIPLIKSGKQDSEVLDTLFLSALARHPSTAESRSILDAIKRSPKRDEAFQDALWALLNSEEFLFDH